MAKRSLKKKEFSLKDFKSKVNGEDIPNKPLEWYKVSKAVKDATGLDGIPKGYVSLFRGYSNTGKSTLLCETIVSAQKSGDFVIIIDTENNLGRERLKSMGFDWDGNVLYIDNEYLLENYGKLQDKNRTQASIEDLAKCIEHFMELQVNEDLPFNILFAIDSIGTLDCIKTINAYEKDGESNNMWNALALEKSFKSILNSKIPATRKTNKEYFVTLCGVQKIWIDSMAGAGIIKHKGGEAMYYGARIILHLGGIISHGTKKVKAISNKRDVVFGIENKIGVVKNQIDGGLGGISLEGKVISTPHGFIGTEKSDIDEYKKNNLKFFRDTLGSDLSENDFKIEYEQSVDKETGEIIEVD